jgi:hypothetical protein
MKTCTKCKEEKKLIEFHKSVKKLFGVNNICKLCSKEVLRLWRKNNVEKVKYHNKKYKNKEYKKNRKKTDSLFKLKCNISSLIYSSFKKNSHHKNSKTKEILGCSFEKFKVHLEKQFKDDMSWENQGKWHLDHIYPVSLAKDEEELIKLNHYTNFQPLWAFDNISKGNKIIEKQLILI